MLKAAVQKGISFLPAKQKVNYWFQKNITQGVKLTDEHFGYKVEHARDHITFFNKYGNPGTDKTILELGTGWYPIIPLFMYLTDSGKVISIDIQSWQSKDQHLTAIKKIQEWKVSGKLGTFLDQLKPERWKTLQAILDQPEAYSLGSINQEIGLQVLIQDARQAEMATGSIDFICSNNTFEHIYPDVLSGILKEFKRVLRPDGVMSHFIDLSDHFAHFDASINVYNFLQFSEKDWQRIDNSIQPQNRLRMPAYRALYEKLDIPIIEESLRKGNVELLRQISIHEEFQDYSLEDLAITHGYLVTRMDALIDPSATESDEPD